MVEYIKGDIMSDRNRTVEFKKATDRPCMSCNPAKGGEGKFLHIRNVIEDTVVLECPNCGYTEHKSTGDVPGSIEVRDIRGNLIA